MWRSGAPQRRVARGTPKGCRCTYVLLCDVALKSGIFSAKQLAKAITRYEALFNSECKSIEILISASACKLGH